MTIGILRLKEIRWYKWHAHRCSGGSVSVRTRSDNRAKGKKDYIDLHFIFQKLGEENVLRDFKNYNPLISVKSILFGLGEVDVAEQNKSVMPEMLIPITWHEVKESMLHAASIFLKISKERKDSAGI